MLQMYLASTYQYAISLLSYNVEMSIGADGKPFLVQQLPLLLSPTDKVAKRQSWYLDSPKTSSVYEAARLLHTLSLAFETRETAAKVPEADVRKNAALAMMKAAPVVSSAPQDKQMAFISEAVSCVTICVLLACFAIY